MQYHRSMWFIASLFDFHGLSMKPPLTVKTVIMFAEFDRIYTARYQYTDGENPCGTLKHLCRHAIAIHELIAAGQWKDVIGCCASDMWLKTKVRHRTLLASTSNKLGFPGSSILMESDYLCTTSLYYFMFDLISRLLRVYNLMM